MQCLFFPSPPPPKRCPTSPFTTSNGKPVTDDLLAYRKFLTVIFYDTDCEHCRQQATEIGRNMRRFKNTLLVWLTIGEEEVIRAFRQQYFAETCEDKVLFLQDRNMSVFNTFEGMDGTTPIIYIFDKERNQLAACTKFRPMNWQSIIGSRLSVASCWLARCSFPRRIILQGFV